VMSAIRSLPDLPMVMCRAPRDKSGARRDGSTVSPARSHSAEGPEFEATFSSRTFFLSSLLDRVHRATTKNQLDLRRGFLGGLFGRLACSTGGAIDILEDGLVSVAESGTGQDSVISPLLANIYLHYVLDLWAERWRRQRPAAT